MNPKTDNTLYNINMKNMFDKQMQALSSTEKNTQKLRIVIRYSKASETLLASLSILPASVKGEQNNNLTPH